MAKAHMKRMSAPRTWPINRKSTMFVRRPDPGAQRFEHGMSLQTWIVEILNAASSAREAREAIRKGAIKVNGKVAKSQDLIVGLFDVISIEGVGDYLITLTAQNKLRAAQTTYTGENLSRVEGKSVVKGGIIQYRLLNGHNVRSDSTYSVGQTVIVKDGKIDRVLALEKGSTVYFTRGASIGHRGTVQAVENDHVVINVNDKDIESHRDVFVVVTGFAPLKGDA